MGANYSIVFSGSNAHGTSIAVGDYVVPDLLNPNVYVVATTANLAGRRPEAIALTPAGPRTGTFQLQQVGCVSERYTGYTGGSSWVRCSALGRTEACTSGDPLLVGRAEDDGRVHLLMSLPLFSELPLATGPGVLLFDGTTITHLPVAGASEGDVLTLGLGLSLGWASGGGGGGAFNPLSISGAVVSYDPAAATQSGGLVTVVPDGSGNARNGVITGGQEPTYIATDAAYNNKPTFSFPASGTKRIGVPNMGITTNPYTIVMVADTQTAGYLCSANNPNDMAEIYSSSSAVAFSSAYLPVGRLITDGLATAKNVIVAVGDGVSSRIYVSKKTPVTGNAGTHDLTGNVGLLGNYLNSIAGAFSQNGKTAYFGVWGRALTNTECGTMLDGLGATFSVAIGA